MAVALTVLVIAYLANHLKAAAIPPQASNRPCVEFMLPVSVTAQNAVFNLTHVDNNIDAVAYEQDLDRWAKPTPIERITKNITVSETFSISAQLCIPPNGAKKTSLQIATHGLVFDKRYWDITINPSEYSYVDAALDAGYSILTYDRLGTGLSDKPDAYTIVQAPVQLEILRIITEMARSGELLKHTPGYSEDKSVTFGKIIHVGHSFGSFLSSALLFTYGNLSDGAIITGYILNPEFATSRVGAFGLEYAAQNDPKLFGDRGSGYVVPAAASNVQTGFFSVLQNEATGIGGFEPELLDLATLIRQPFTTTEMTSPALLNLGVAPNFTGPIQFMLAEYDYLVCAGDCRGVYDTTVLDALYPNATEIDVYLQPGSGHGLTAHRKARTGYQVTLDWLNKNGL